MPGALALIGFAFVIGGAGILALADMDLIAEAVAAGTIQSDVFTGDTLVAVTVATAYWSGIGLLLAGVASWIGALGYNRIRHRERLGSESTPDRRGVWSNGLIGAVAAILLSFIPFSPFLGGAIAGYLQHGDGDTNLKAGGLAGLFAAVPLAFILVGVFGGMLAGAMGAQAFGGMAFVVGLLVAGLLFGVVATVLLGAFGGYVGGYLSRNRSQSA